MFGAMWLRRSIRRLWRVGVRLPLKRISMALPAKGRIIRQSAVIPHRLRGERLEVLLITSRGSGDWIVPKGLLEPDMTAHDSAAKEAEEEAGVVGVVGSESIGSFEYEKWGGLCIVSVFDMEVRQELSDWPEKDERTRRWFDVKDAPALVKHKSLGKLIAGLSARVPLQ